MNKAILIKAGIVLGAFILMLGLAFGCTAVKNNDKTPLLKDGDNVFVTVDGIQVTDQELYEEMKLSNGLSYLMQYAEEQLLASYLANVTDDELWAEKELLTYGTDDQIIIDRYKADTDVDEQLVNNFEDNLILLGLDPSNVDDLRIYLGLSIAKQKYTQEYILGLESTDPLFISEDDKQAYYEENTYADNCTLDIRFHSEKEAELVLNHFNIVPNYDGVSWGLYDPTANDDIAIKDVESGGFNDTNTTVLTEDKAFLKFVLIYNYMNPTKTQIPENISKEDFCTDFADIANRNYEDMTRLISSDSDAMKYVDYIFNTLSLADNEDDTPSSPYSYKVQTIGDFAVIAYKVSEETVTPYIDLTDDEKDEVMDDLLTSKLTSSSLAIAMEELWLDNELVIYDPILKLQHKFEKGKEFDNNGSTEIIATLGDKEITARIIFDFMTENFGMYSALEVAQTKLLLQSDLYNDVYDGTDNYLKSDNATMKKHIEDLEGFKQYFASDGFASYNLSSTEYTWEEFIVLYLQCSNEMDVLEDISIAGNLQNYLINDTINYEAAVAYLQDQVDNYFSLNVEHLLLFVDEDFDFSGDDYSDYLATLTVDEKAAYDALTTSFSLIVQGKVKDDEMTLSEIVTEYQDSLIGDETNVWAPFKEAGFYIITQDLSENASLTYASTNGLFDKDFVENVKRAYDAYVLEIDQSIEEPAKYYDDRVFESDFGVHYITATKGTDFEQPTAVFDNADGDYVAGNVGTTIAPNKTQVELYIDINFSTKISESNDSTLAKSVSDALDAYYSSLFAKYWPSSENSSIPVTLVTVGYALDHNVTFADNNAERTADLQIILIH
jgi:hypothetical protein